MFIALAMFFGFNKAGEPAPVVPGTQAWDAAATWDSATLWS